MARCSFACAAGDKSETSSRSSVPVVRVLQPAETTRLSPPPSALAELLESADNRPASMDQHVSASIRFLKKHQFTGFDHGPHHLDVLARCGASIARSFR